MAKIMKENTWKYVCKNIVCPKGYLIPCIQQRYTFRRKKNFNSNCEKLDIMRDFSIPYYLQSNGQVEAVNKIIKHTLKRKLESTKGDRLKNYPRPYGHIELPREWKLVKLYSSWHMGQKKLFLSI
ncbi:Integrase catalytic domain-containing protein [Abeliophyllum distichum]|uniref:Integrase catalytic domain-containing protein n=1 Tax=Abeliophyllum distichum TaxID=126358 RepID=A0ABD1SZ08_9LAMI